MLARLERAPPLCEGWRTLTPSDRRKGERRDSGTGLSRLYDSLGRRLGKRLFDEVRRSDSLRPRLNPSKVAATLLATLVHGLTILFGAAGVLLIVKHTYVVNVIAGFVLLLLAWAVHPRFGKRPKSLVARSQAPHLYALADAVAGQLKARRVEAIRIGPQFQASISSVGWRRRRYLSLGLPLLVVLEPQERVAVVAHELAHEVNGDPLRGVFIGSAAQTLVEWYKLLRPSQLPRQRAGRYSRTGGYTGARRFAGFSMVGEMVAHGLMGAVAAVVLSIHRLLLHLIWRDSQRAEYLADELSARVAGSAAAVSALQKTPLALTYREVVQSAGHTQSGERSIFAKFRDLCMDPASPSISNARVMSSQGTFRLDATHPPTSYRIEFLLGRSPDAAMTLTLGESAAIDREVEVFEAARQKARTAAYRAARYR
jgi:Zn-dependent protease with chaperone function